MGLLTDILLFMDYTGIFDVVIPLLAMWFMLLYIGVKRFVKQQRTLKKVFIIIGVWMGAYIIAYLLVAIPQIISTIYNPAKYLVFVFLLVVAYLVDRERRKK